MNSVNLLADGDSVSTNNQCPNCGSPNLEHKKVVDRFKYGSGKDAPELSAVIPISRCLNCELEFSGAAAETARDEAIRTRLGLLTPHRIAEVRGRYDLPRATFAEISRIGLATLARWEIGETVQNRAMDMYMRLLERPEVFRLVASGAILEGDRFARSTLHSPSFPALERSQSGPSRLKEKEERSKIFSLVPVAATG
jgi:DNA-binding transcriptional regulator YiaG